MEKLNNARSYGLGAGVLLLVGIMLPWISVNVPLYGSVNAAGIKTDDGKVMLVIAIALIVLSLIPVVAAWADAHVWCWWVVGGVITATAIYDIAHIATKSFVDKGDDEFSQSLEKSMQANAGIGLWLTLIVGIVLVALPFVLKATNKSAVTAASI